MSKNSLEDKGSTSAQATENTPLISKNEHANGGDVPGKGDENGSLSAKQTALLIAGEMAGSGVLALPRAMVRTGWVGVPLLILMGVIAAFSGKRLGDCWSILEERDPQMRSRKRNPYAIIADQALGKTWSVVASMAMIVTQFGASVVYLLLAAQIIEQVFLTLIPTLSICWWYLIVAGAMTPLLLFGTPKDFSFLGVIAFGSVVVACILYFIQMLFDIKPFGVFRWGLHNFQQFFLSFGTMMFAFGGASTFPTIQNDMADKSKFSKVLQYSFTAILGLYLPIAIGGYAVYGESVAPNVSASLSPTPVTLAGNILMVIHLVSAFIILVNPVCQEIEELYDVPRDSIAWRMGVRGCIMAGILFIGESVPRFYTILALIGGSTVALLTFVLPSYCYLKLIQPSEGRAAIEVPGWIKVVCWEVIAVGAIGGTFATVAAINAIFSTAQTTPCYLR
ncbi:amino acid transporter AVT1B-like [Hyposmocoma kahamanoa]|uniref:amino acid transporter AVT1B-like n=1 Tax=Hyposmocoma kahamanoa TaxID=1477025 RepID=UPI000E6D7540|nr:amino acid transporter AVT1B-like [Hyposmocoma kahamanoa]XP_026314607.1 amino acid transporter AVT1B-like [Hyposmocoma kahamanoa]